MNRHLIILLLAVCSFIRPSDSWAAAPEPAESKRIAFFEAKIRPVLVKHCYECHSVTAQQIEGSLLVDSKPGLLKGGETGPAVVPGKVQKSLLISSLEYQDYEMPPAGKLSDDIVADFRKWVQMGAPDPRTTPVVASRDTGPVAVSADQLWSLQPTVKPAVPETKDPSWSRDQIDNFVRAKLDAAGLAPVGDAKPLTLLRRVYFDLIGLPPTPAEIRSFQASLESSPTTAFSDVVDHLLDSPHFGERWGRHWLDVARYAESNGKSRDVLFPYAWRYRNWVIDAMNDDLSFDQFVIQQIAGDLLAAGTPQQRRQHQIATGLLAIGSKPLVGGNLQQDMVDDQIDVVTRGFLGLTASCARCHDHKFDPIPTADYYSLAGIFNSTKTFYGGGAGRPKTIAQAAKLWLVLGDHDPEALEKVEALQKQADQVKKRRDAAAKRMQTLKRNATRNPNSEKSPKAVEIFVAAESKLNELNAQLSQVKTELDAVDLELAMGVADSAKPTDSPILIRGEKNQRGKVVPRGFLSCIRTIPVVAIPDKHSGRLELAQWIADKDNPLTVRVAVNRIWYHLFGRGIVETLDNFGSNGANPSHPELLDHLSTRFVENGMSTKSLIRVIVLSRTYQLSTMFDAAAYQVDPGNVLLWRANRRRLEVEAIRDALLVAGGMIQFERPETSVVAEIGEGEVGRGINEQPLKAPFYHRSIYLPILRTALSDLLKTFDFPDPSNLQGRRIVTNVPTQSLFLLNNSLVIEQAQSLAEASCAASDIPSDRVNHAYMAAFGRPSTPAETQAALDFISQTSSPLATDAAGQLAAWTTFCQALFASAEFRFAN
jgi:mono/diheme cytochrome c family protein